MHFIDGQTGSDYDLDYLFNKIIIGVSEFSRLDNCEPTDEVLRCINKVGSDVIFMSDIMFDKIII